MKYLVYSSKGFKDAYDNCDVVAKKLESMENFFTKIPTDKLCTTDFTVTFGDAKYVVKVQKTAVDTSKLIHKNVKDLITLAEEEKGIKNIQNLYTYFADVFIKKIYVDNQDTEIKELYKNLMAEVADGHQGCDTTSKFTVVQDANQKYCTVNSTTDTHAHNIYAPYSNLNTNTNTYPSVLFVPTNLFNQRDKVADNKVRSSVLSLPKYVNFKAIDINEADKSVTNKGDQIAYCLEQTFVEHTGTLTEEQKKENEINYNEAVKKVEDTLQKIDTIMKDLAMLARNSTKFSEEVRKFTKQKLQVLTKELDAKGLKIHIGENNNKDKGPVLESKMPNEQCILQEALDKGIDHSNFVNGAIKQEIINHINNSTSSTLSNENKLQLNIKIPDLYKKSKKLSQQDLNEHLQKSLENENNLLIKKEIKIEGSNEKALLYFHFKNNLPKKSLMKPCNANGVQYGLEYQREITRLIEHVLEEIKILNPFNFKFDNKKTEDIKKEKHREIVLGKYLFSAESNSVPKIEINDNRSERSKQVNESAGILYDQCIVTLPKEKETDQTRPINFEVILTNLNYVDQSS